MNSAERPIHRMAHLRPATESDAGELARLTGELGYPATVPVIRSRLPRMLSSPDVCLLVAEDSSGALAGWIQGILRQLLESEYRVEIGGLVVDTRWRRQGIGRRLVRAMERWAAERGAVELSVRCRVERAEAHAFYESLGFARAKTQHAFRKRLGSSGA